MQVRGTLSRVETASRPVGGILSSPEGPGWPSIYAAYLERGGRATLLLLGLAPGGGCQPPGSLRTLVRSYRTVSPLPVQAGACHRRSALCCPDPAGHPVLALASTLPYGVPTFLDGVVPRRGHPAGSPSRTRLTRDVRSLAETRAFFSERAAAWDERFGHDAEVYAHAVEALDLRPGMRVLDVGCGTARATPALREAVGSTGHVLAVDATDAMIEAARRAGRHQHAALLVGDAERPPFRTTPTFDRIFAAGLLPHMDDPERALREWRALAATGGRLMVFHPISRVALAARHHTQATDDDVVAEPRLRPLLQRAGWSLRTILDEPDRPYQAVAEAS